jgi:hypothetical protein
MSFYEEYDKVKVGDYCPCCADFNSVVYTKDTWGLRWGCVSQRGAGKVHSHYARSIIKLMNEGTWKILGNGDEPEAVGEENEFGVVSP